MAQSLVSHGERGGVKNAWLDVAAAQTDAVLVAAEPGRKIVVIGVFANGKDAGASLLTFNSKGAGAGTAISPIFDVAADGGFVMPQEHGGWFETIKGEALTATTGAASATALIVVYRMAA